jgi:hypothetical protein
MARIEVTPIGRNIGEMKAAGIPNYRQYQFF